MGKVKVSIANNQTQVKIPVGIRLLVRRCCHAVTEYEGFNDDFEVSVSFVDDETIHKLNLEHRNVDRSTDVLSFPLGENGKYDLNRETGAFLLGDIVISLETACRQAELYEHSLEREVGFLTVHSMLKALLKNALCVKKKRLYLATLVFRAMQHLSASMSITIHNET